MSLVVFSAACAFRRLKFNFSGSPVCAADVLVRIGSSGVVVGSTIALVVFLGIYVLTKSFIARDHNFGVPSAVSFLACVLHPLIGLVAVVCLGIVQYGE